jgi:hypothetical protein
LIFVAGRCENHWNVQMKESSVRKYV